MEHNTTSVNLKNIIDTFIKERGLPFTVVSADKTNGSRGDAIVSSIYGRCRALVWDSEPHKIYETTKLHPCVTIYNLNPERGYTAIGDRRCELSVAAPDFFEQLEYHLLHENEPEIV